MSAPLRLRLCAWIAAKLDISTVTLRGLECLDALSPDDRVVFAVTHITDTDMKIATYVLGRYFDIRVTDKSSHHSFWENAQVHIALRITGEKFFFPIDYREGRPAQGFFNPNNYIPMAQAIERGKAILIAAHKPMWEPELPARGGIGAVYLAGIADARIVPVAVRLNRIPRSIFHRPRAEMIIGEPIDFGPIAEHKSASEDKTELGRRSGVVMAQLAQLLGRV